jgi:hypothetical protein
MLESHRASEYILVVVAANPIMMPIARVRYVRRNWLIITRYDSLARIGNMLALEFNFDPG